MVILITVWLVSACIVFMQYLIQLRESWKETSKTSFWITPNILFLVVILLIAITLGPIGLILFLILDINISVEKKDE